MDSRNKSLILSSIKYNDSVNIVTAYSLDGGRNSYVFYRGKGNRQAVKHVYVQPFSLVEMVVSQKKTGMLPRIKELFPVLPMDGLLFNPLKTSIAVFLAEMLSRVLHDTERDPELFSFLENSVRVLNFIEKGVANFHLAFLIQLTRFLGYYPNMEYADDMPRYFDVENGFFVSMPPMHPYFLSQDESRFFVQLMRMNYKNMHFFTFSRHERRTVLQQIMRYYQLHLPDFKEPRSLSVLQDLFE